MYWTKTTEQGTFQFPRIADAGSYTLSIDQAGFCKIEIMAIVVPGEGQNCPKAASSILEK
ncbi:MAG: hypothetical protein M3N41_07715 [Acidobacteriota bacterium]|nr:hypothetical protein [Acidobacteriota bacterium]